MKKLTLFVTLLSSISVFANDTIKCAISLVDGGYSYHVSYALDYCKENGPKTLECAKGLVDSEYSSHISYAVEYCK